MLETWRHEWRTTPAPPLWRALLFAVGVVAVLTWPLVRGERLDALPAALAGLAGLALVHDLVLFAWPLGRSRRRRQGVAAAAED